MQTSTTTSNKPFESKNIELLKLSSKNDFSLKKFSPKKVSTKMDISTQVGAMSLRTEPESGRPEIVFPSLGTFLVTSENLKKYGILTEKNEEIFNSLVNAHYRFTESEKDLLILISKNLNTVAKRFDTAFKHESPFPQDGDVIGLKNSTSREEVGEVFFYDAKKNLIVPPQEFKGKRVPPIEFARVVGNEEYFDLTYYDDEIHQYAIVPIDFSRDDWTQKFLEWTTEIVNLKNRDDTTGRFLLIIPNGHFQGNILVELSEGQTKLNGIDILTEKPHYLERIIDEPINDTILHSVGAEIVFTYVLYR